MTLSPDAKKLLAEIIRGTAQSPDKGIRDQLLLALGDEAERRYRFQLPIEKAGLDEVHRQQRQRIEDWISERVRATRPKNPADFQDARKRFLSEAIKETAATLLNRLVFLRQLEALGLSRPAVLSGGWMSPGYREFREFAPGLCLNGTTDATEGMGLLLQLIFDELAIDLPGLFGNVGLTRLFPVPPSMLRDLIDRLNDRRLASVWADDTTLGWVYQYWNDPDREALDAKINAGGKIEPHEIASKTQMFTERYMVEWLLQNSLGLTWLCTCKKHGWTADAERVLPVLEERRADWRARREAGTVALDALMPIDGELEEHWKYFVPQPLPEDAIANAPDSVRSLKILDPACGSGHFLVIAFGMLTALYREEARHRGTSITEQEIAESILENNLFGIDIDPRAIQIAAASLYLKAKSLARNAHPRWINLVAPSLQLGKLPPNDPVVVQLRRDLKEEVGIPEELTSKLLASLADVDFLGSLLKVDAAVESALQSVELEFERTQGQGDLFRGFPAQQVKLSLGEAKATVLDKLEMFLEKHSTSGDLGLRLGGEQLVAGVRFTRIAIEGTYDIVAGNPPYLGVGKLKNSLYYVAHYPEAKADLFAGFYLRSLELIREHGICAMITLSNWMFLGAYSTLRKTLLRNTVVAIADLGKAAFTTGGTLISTACAVLSRGTPKPSAVAIQPHSAAEVIRDEGQPERTNAALLIQRGRHEFDPRAFELIDGAPIVYWWSIDLLKKYASVPKLGELAPVKVGLQTSNNERFLRRPWEIPSSRSRTPFDPWVPYIKGAAGREWFEPLDDLVRWDMAGAEIRNFYISGKLASRPQNLEWYFKIGIAFSKIGSSFSARLHRFPSIFDVAGQSVFPDAPNLARTLCAMNSGEARNILQSLNPTVNFQVGDVIRLPIFSVEGSDQIINVLSAEFSAHEAARETSVEFSRPAPTPWHHAQVWAQRAVDRPQGSSLPLYKPEFVTPAPSAFVSFTIGVTLGRFDANGEGILEQAPPSALPAGILFVAPEEGDSLEHPACAPIHASWEEHGATVGEGDDLRTYLCKSFFEYHKKLYENRPIYFPLSSAKRTFVAWVSIHRWKDDTLNLLLAEHLVPLRRRYEGEMTDLRTERATASNRNRAERRYGEVQKLLEELNDFIAKVTDIAEQGPPPLDSKTPAREVDARYAMDLDDGVMVNSAALWPLLEPQWKDPKKWWKELAAAQGKKDYDWSHLAARYFPTRVRKKCETDPSLAVAHGCFWTLHPAKAYAWELRLQDEIRPEFTIDEAGSDEARERFLAEHAEEAAEIEAAERRRRERKAARGGEEEAAGPLFQEGDESEEPGDE